MKFKSKFRQLIRTVFPANMEEMLVFGLFGFCYGVLAYFIAVNYRIVFDNRIPWDAYFSFDNRSIVLTGGGFERHPLSVYFFKWLRRLALLFSGGKFDADFRIFLSACSAIAVSLSTVQIFKYLRHIIGLPSWLCWLLTVFFGLFSTTLLLSFTPETYTYTLLCLCLFNYYSALKLRRGKGISSSALLLGLISVGGLTITNAAKIFLPVLADVNGYNKAKNLARTALRSVIAVAVFIFLYLARLDFDFTRILNKTGEQYEKFSQPKVTPVWDMILSWFLGGNVLFPGFVVRDYHSKEGFEYKAIFMDVYSSTVSLVFVFVLVVLVLWAILRNYGNRLVWVLAGSFLVDVIIHCVMKFGLHTSYIYGGHFVFVYPWLLGWLFYSYRYNSRVLSLLTALLCILTLYLGANNYYRFQVFIQFLNLFYQ